MKRIFFSMALLCLSVIVCSQQNRPCASGLDVGNNGNGGQGCPSKHPSDVSYKKDGMIVLKFNSALPANVQPPDILTVRRLVNEILQQAPDMKFIMKAVAHDRLSAEYCFYSKNNSNLFNGSKGKYEFTIQYQGFSPQVCEMVEEGALPVLLPVSFHSFSIEKKNGQVNLNWATSSEMNSKGYYVQRKNGNAGWKELGFVTSAAANGESNEMLEYSFTDRELKEGLNYYRLRQVDLDGKESFSEIRSLEISSGNHISIYPNPSYNGAIHIRLNTMDHDHQFMIYDQMGRLVKQAKIAGGQALISGLTSGQYMVLIKNKDQMTLRTERIIVQKQ